MNSLEVDIKRYLVEELDKFDLTLYSVHYYQEAGSNILEILLDDDNQEIKLDKIVKMTPIISEVLDKVDLIKDNYILDLSTPGLLRPLYEKEHYQKVIGQKIEILLKNQVVTGVLKEVNQDKIAIEVNKKIEEINFNEIVKARIQKGDNKK